MVLLWISYYHHYPLVRMKYVIVPQLKMTNRKAPFLHHKTTTKKIKLQRSGSTHGMINRTLHSLRSTPPSNRWRPKEKPMYSSLTKQLAYIAFYQCTIPSLTHSRAHRRLKTCYNQHLNEGKEWQYFQSGQSNTLKCWMPTSEYSFQQNK